MDGWTWRGFLMLGVLLLVMAPAEAVTPMLAVGASHSVMLGNDGTVLTVGNDSSGQLGHGRALSSSVAVQVTGLASARKMVGGVGHPVALAADRVLGE